MFDEKGVRLPLMISVTITDRSGRTLSGQTIDAELSLLRDPAKAQRALDVVNGNTLPLAA